MSAGPSQAYQLKSIRFQDAPRKILLQNENGPCPLLAAANALLLRGVVKLDPACVRSGVASADDVVNLLANRALLAGENGANPNGPDGSDGGSSNHAYHLNEVLGLLPSLQHGMDVNPKFAAGPTGVEYTKNLAAFDLLGVELVHGWLLDEQDADTAAVVGSKTYNELIELVIRGNEAREGVKKLEGGMREKEKVLEGGVIVESPDNSESADASDGGGEGSAPNAAKGGGGGDLPAGGGAPAIPGEEAAREGPEGAVAAESLENAGASDVEGGSGDLPSKEEIRDETEGGAAAENSEDSGEPEGAGGAPAVPGDEVAENKGSSSAEPPEEWLLVGKETGDARVEEGGGARSGAKKEGGSGDLPSKEDVREGTATGSEILPNAPEQRTRALTEAEKATLRKEISDAGEKMSELSLQITRAAVANAFLTSSGHQLTYHGLEQLHKHMGNGALSVFFRNNHFATLTKHKGVLYLLATDLGYANTPEIVWEKLDNIDGDTEYANEFFAKPAPREELKPAPGPTIAPELLLAQRGQAETDYQLALAMSKGAAAPSGTADEEGRLMEAAKELSLKTYNGDAGATINVGPANQSQVDADHEMALAYEREQRRGEHDSEQLARQLQELEYVRGRPAARRRAAARPAPPPRREEASAMSGCVMS